MKSNDLSLSTSSTDDLLGTLHGSPCHRGHPQLYRPHTGQGAYSTTAYRDAKMISHDIVTARLDYCNSQ